jgi:hypothetical protein
MSRCGYFDGPTLAKRLKKQRQEKRRKIKMTKLREDIVQILCVILLVLFFPLSGLLESEKDDWEI